MEEIYRRLEADFDRTLADLVRLCRQPSVSTEGQWMGESAALVAQMLKESGLSAQVLPSGGHPVVYGERRGDSPLTLLFYNHYDVQPPDPVEAWSSPPFEPQLRDHRLYGRGVADNKGDLVARLAVIRAFLEVRGSLPLSVKFCIEGEEELGSPHLPRFVAEHRELLQADVCLWEGGEVNWEGRPVIILGAKGILYVELEAQTASRDAHSSLATVVPNAAWRLLWALASLKDAEENILIDGFYEAVRPPGPADLAALSAIPLEDDELRRSYGLDRLVKGVSGVDYLRRHLFEPTCTICGLEAGFTGAGLKTVSPGRARAKLDFRLVPDQRPEDILTKLRRHLDRGGFSDVTVTPLGGGEEPARTPPDSPFVRVVAEVARRIYHTEPVIMPTMAATGPMFCFVNTLGLPIASAGVGYPDTRIHAPDEHIRLEDFRRGVKYLATILDQLSRTSPEAMRPLQRGSKERKR